MKLSVASITLPTGKWWEMAGHDANRLRHAWINTHHAVQPAAELGKGWAHAQDDDSHSNFFWVDGDNLLDGMMVGHSAAAKSGIYAALRLWDLRLFVVDDSGTPLAQTDLQGKSASESVAWVRGIASEHAGDPRQEAKPAPDLPEHPEGDNFAFEEPHQLAQAELVRIYANTSRQLEAIENDLATSIDPKTWPHHFDMAGLVIIKQDAKGSMTNTIGLGVTPPDSGSDEGYWYVSPWIKGGASGGTWNTLDHGSWSHREGSFPMAMMPISAVTETEDPKEQARRLATFFATAFNTCVENMNDA